jgi:hypothetical protein
MTNARATLSLFAVAAGILVADPATAQLNTVGFRLGVGRATQVGGFADVVEDVGGKTESRTGLVAGAFANYAIPAVTSGFSLQAGLDLTQKGVRIPEEGGLAQRALDITYLEFSALARASLGSGVFRPFAYAGPGVSFKLSTSGEVRGQSIETDDEVKGTDLGFVLGVGARRGAVGVDLRYVIGLTNISESSDPDEAARNRHWAIAGTYEIPIRR